MYPKRSKKPEILLSLLVGTHTHLIMTIFMCVVFVILICVVNPYFIDISDPCSENTKVKLNSNSSDKKKEELKISNL